MKRAYYIIITILLITIAGYFFISSFLNSRHNGDPIPQSNVDVRPLIITKLQQIVKEGSNGLYNLSVEKLEPDVLRSELKVLRGTLTPDSAELMKLDIAKKVPDNVFRISFDSLRISGIAPQDLLEKDRLSLDSVFITKPIIETYYQPRPYNETKRNENDSATLYQRLMKQFKSISVHAIVVKHATLINHDLSQKDNNKRFNNLSMTANNLLIDSITQYDKNRFLFAREAELSCENYETRTPDNLYTFKIGAVSVHATKHTIIAKDVFLIPRYNKEEFKKKVRSRKDYFDMRFPKVVLNNIDWWAFANSENLSAAESDIYNARIKDYIDRSLPEGSAPADNFPSKLLVQFPLKINIAKLNLHDMDIVYEEYNPSTKKSSSVYFDNMNGTIGNLTNLPPSIKVNKNATFSGSCLFMHQIPAECRFQFDLAKYKTGDFSINLQIGTLNKTVLNPFTEPLGLFTVKRGTMQKASAYIEGNNSIARGEILMLYNDLHIIPLETDGDNKLRKKPVMSFFANTFYIKNENPSKGNAPRSANIVVKRGNQSFFGLIWEIMLKGILKTIGVPEKYAE